MARSDQPDEPAGRGQQRRVRVELAKELIREAYENGEAPSATEIAQVICERFEVAIRTGYFDYTAAIAQLDQWERDRIDEQNANVIASREEAIAGWLDMLARAVEAADFKAETEARKQIDKIRGHCQPKQVQVNVTTSAPLDFSRHTNDELRSVIDGIRKARESSQPEIPGDRGGNRHN